MNVALHNPPPRPRTEAPRPPRAPANDLVAVLREQLPLLMACAAFVALCVFAVTAAHGQPLLR